MHFVVNTSQKVYFPLPSADVSKCHRRRGGFLHQYFTRRCSDAPEESWDISQTTTLSLPVSPTAWQWKSF